MREQLIDGPLVPRVLAVFYGHDLPPRVEEKVGWQAKLTTRGCQTRGLTGATEGPRDLRPNEGHPQPKAWVEDGAGRGLHTEGAVEVLVWIRDHGGG